MILLPVEVSPMTTARPVLRLLIGRASGAYSTSSASDGQPVQGDVLDVRVVPFDVIEVEHSAAPGPIGHRPVNYKPTRWMVKGDRPARLARGRDVVGAARRAWRTVAGSR